MNPQPPALARDLNQGFQQQVRVGVSGAQVGAGPHAGRIIVGAQTDFLFAQPAHDSGGIDDATVGPVGGETHQPGSWGPCSRMLMPASWRKPLQRDSLRL
jgi:hypothetical protein